MTADPKPRADGNCVYCGKPKNRTRRSTSDAAKDMKVHTRQNRKLWLVHLDSDPWCSRTCLERHHNITVSRGPMVCDRLGCDTRFTPQPNQVRQRFCSKKCRDAEKKRAKWSIPGMCSGCGGDLSEYVKGCSQCADRRRSRARRSDPEYVAGELGRDRERRLERKAA